MDIRKRLLAPHAITAFAMTVALTFPCVVEAVSIGEIVLQSKLGEPLLARVDLMAESGEHVEDSCLSLAAPDPHEKDSSGYLTKANLSIKTAGGRQYVDISSHKPFNDAFAILRVQVKCPGTGSVIKTLTILPDLDVSVPQAPITAPSAPAKAENIAPPANAHPPATIRRNAHDTQPDVAEYLADKAARPVHKRQTSARAASKQQGSSASFRLKLSGEPLDESRIGKISAEERALLLARQKLVDADDQTASFLAVQHQVKQLQDELGAIKLQLAQLGVSPVTVASSVTVPSSLTAPSSAPLATADTRENHPKPAVTVIQPVAQQDNLALKYGLFAALGMALVILALWLGLRHYTKIKSRGETKPQQNNVKSQQNAAPILKPAANAATAQNEPKMAAAPVFKRIPQVKSPPPSAAKASTSAAAPPSPPPSSRESEEELSEDDSMLEEAGLYATHGRPAKAVDILQEIIKRHPSKAEAWTLLLSVYSSLARVAEFEKTAQEFLKHHKDSPAWNGIRALGRTLDRDNPLYADNNSRIAAASPLLSDAAPRRPVGDILMEMGVVSDMELQHCLDTFDPKKHGRFGGYLVASKVITLAQLDQALLQQQGIYNGNEVRTGALPSLQSMETFLADFDPKRDGSVGEFLASHNASTPEQLSQLLQQQSSQGAAANPPQADGQSPLGQVSTVGSVLKPAPKYASLDLEFEPTDKSKPLDFKPEPPPLDFPKINLDLANDNPPSKKE